MRCSSKSGAATSWHPALLMAAEQGGADDIAAASVAPVPQPVLKDDRWVTDLATDAAHVAEVKYGPSVEDLDRAGLGELRNRCFVPGTHFGLVAYAVANRREDYVAALVGQKTDVDSRGVVSASALFYCHLPQQQRL
jgi:hypothetical protein